MEAIMANTILSTEQGSQLAIERIADIPLPTSGPIGVATDSGLVYVTISYFTTDLATNQRAEPAMPGTLAVIDDETQKVLHYVPIGHAPRYVAVDPTTRRIFVTHNTTPGHVTVLDGTAMPPAVIKTVQVGRNPLGVAVNAQNSRVYIAHAVDATLTILDGSSLEKLGEIFLENGIHIDRIAVDSQLNRVYVPALSVTDSPHAPWLYIVDEGTVGADTPQWSKVSLASELVNGAIPRTVAIDQEHQRVYVANFSNATNSVSVLQPLPSQVITTVQEPGSLASDIAVDSQKNLVYVSNSIISSLSNLGIGMSILDGETLRFFQLPDELAQPDTKERHGAWELGIAGASGHVYVIDSKEPGVSVVETARLVPAVS
jgi:DNA-binding beta-propeller fold protein YncE